MQYQSRIIFIAILSIGLLVATGANASLMTAEFTGHILSVDSPTISIKVGDSFGIKTNYDDSAGYNVTTCCTNGGILTRYITPLTSVTSWWGSLPNEIEKNAPTSILATGYSEDVIGYGYSFWHIIGTGFQITIAQGGGYTDYWTLSNGNGQIFVSGSSSSSLTIYPTPATVPLPAATWLLGSGLLGLVSVARRKIV